MDRGRLLVRVIAFVTLVAMAAIILLIVAGSAGASWSGEPLPAWGDDWWIYQDTVYTDEVIDLYGSIYIDGGVSVTLEGCTVTFDNDWSGHHGIEVWWGELYLMSTKNSRMTIQSNSGQPEWYFYVYDWMLYMEGTDLYDLYDGINYYVGWYSGDPQPLYIDDCTIMSTYMGLYSTYDTYIYDSDLYAMYEFNCEGENYELYGTTIETDYDCMYAMSTNTYIEGCTLTSFYDVGIYSDGTTLTIVKSEVTGSYAAIY
jgi:hypothetical protein